MGAVRSWFGFALLFAAAASFAPADTAKSAVTGVPIHLARPPLDDPFPIRRIRVAGDRIDSAIKEHGLGDVTRMPRAEFESKVRRKAEERESPRLVEANWSAALEGGDLSGDAEWTFVNRRSTPALASLGPLKLAVLGATWADGSAAILGVSGDSDSLTLRVPPGRSTLKVKWSAAGGGTDSDRQFDLRLLPCSAATLALDLPADRSPAIGAEAMLTGPFPSARDPKWKQWRFRFGDRTRLELDIHGPSEAGGPLVLGSAVAKLDLTDARLAGTFEFDLRTSRGMHSEWLFHVPPGLTVTDASANDRAAWRFDPATRVLRVVLRQASAGGKFVIAATGPLPGMLAPLPAIRPLNAIGSEERIELRIPAGVALERLDPGEFRLAESSLSADGSRTVVLTGSFATGTARKPPALRAEFAGAEFATDESLEWKIDSNRVVLAARVEAVVRRGPLFRIAFRPPPGFALDRVTSEPESAIAYSAATGEVVEFAKPLATGQQVVLNFEFRGPAPAKGESRFPFPAFAPVGTTDRDGRIAFAPGSGWLLTAHPTGHLGGDAEQGFRYHGLEPGGILVLTPAPATAANPPKKAAVPANAAPLGPRTWSFENAYLVTIASPERPQAFLGGTILSRGDTHLPLQLPPDAQLLSVSIGGKQVAPDTILRLPEGSGPLRFEVRYRLPLPAGPPFRLASPLPELPGDAIPIARWWAIPSEVSAIWPPTMRTPAANGPALRGPLDSNLAFHRVEEGELLLVPTSQVEIAGIAAAVLLAMIGWIGFRLASRTLGTLMLLAMIGIGAAYWLGPESWQRAALPPLVAGLLGVGALAVRRGWNRQTAGVLLAMMFLAADRSIAQAPAESGIVLLVDSAEGEIAVVPQSLLDRLGTSRPEPDTEITGVSYSGRIDDGLARFTAKFQVHVFRDGETTLDLPLADVRLERVAVDGQPAQPLASKPDHYSVPLPGRGLREVEVRFVVPVSSTGAEREVRFGIPAAPDSRVDFAAPLTARQLQAVSRMGGERVAKDKDANRIAAALGAARTLHLRWREGPAGAAATLSVREGCIWDVSDTSQRLTACYQIQVKAGSVPAFRFDVPANLEPTRVAVRSLDSLFVPTVVREWSLGKEANGSRPLTIDLLAPADGRVLVTVECELRTPPVRQPVLSFPRPAGMTREFAVYGLRPTGAVVESIGRAGVIDFAADALVREFGTVPDLRLTPAVHVTAFSPRAGETAELRPVLRPASTPPTALHDATWSVEKDRVLGRGTLTWTGPDAVSMLEFQLGAVVLELRGTDLAAWSQTDGRVQAWLRKPAKDGSLEWTATAKPQGVLDVPLPALVSGRNAGHVVRIRSAPGWGVRVDRDKAWRGVASEEREQAFQCDGTPPPPRVQVFPPGNAVARGFGMLEIAGGAIAMRATVEIGVAAGQPQHFALHAKGLPAGAAPVLDVPPGTLAREHKEADGSLAWDLDVPAGAATSFRATLGLTLPAKGVVSLPIIDLKSGDRSASAAGAISTIALIGAPSGVELAGAKPDADGAALRTAWPGEAERVRRAGGAVFQATGGRVAVGFPLPSAPAPPVESARPAAAPDRERSVSPSVRPPWLPAAAWCGTVFGVLLLFVRSPRSTWPEQLGLLGALFGLAVAEQFAWGIVAYVVARSVWLFRLVFTSRR